MEHTETVATETTHAATGFEALAADPSFWIAVTFTLFAIVFIRYVLPFINKALDDRSAKIRDQLEQANRLREQAQELLASYKAEQEARTREAESIIENAKKDAELLRQQAAQELAQMIERRKQQALEKIARSEQEAVAFVRAEMLEVASKAAVDIIQERLESGKEDPAIGRALAAIQHQIH